MTNSVSAPLGVRACRSPGCPKPVKTRGLCTGHYQSEAKAGRLNEHPPLRAPGGYHAVHLQVAKLLGPARNRRCVDCSGQAQEWSYRGGAPQENRSPTGAAPYARDPAFYEPRCVPCHRVYDLRQACRRGHPYTQENTYMWRGIRSCRSCRTLRREARALIRQESKP